MSSELFKVDQLSGAQVRSLLGLAAGSPPPVATSELLDILREALREDAVENLRTAVKDLRRPLSTVDEGPLSFRRLCKLGRAEEKDLQGQNALSVLTSARTRERILDVMNGYGELLCLDQFPVATRLAGALMRILSVAAMVARHGKQVDRTEAGEISAVLKAISSTRILPKDLLTEYTQKIGAASSVKRPMERTTKARES